MTTATHVDHVCLSSQRLFGYRHEFAYPLIVEYLETFVHPGGFCLAGDITRNLFGRDHCEKCRGEVHRILLAMERDGFVGRVSKTGRNGNVQVQLISRKPQ